MIKIMLNLETFLMMAGISIVNKSFKEWKCKYDN